MSDTEEEWSLDTARAKAHEQVLRERLTFDQAIHMLAMSFVLLEEHMKSSREQRELIKEFSKALDGRKRDMQKFGEMADFIDVAGELVEKQQRIIKATKARAIARSKAAANSLHSKPGGSRDKQAAIRAMWATGKYQSRAICAEQECAALNMSFDAARRALRNTPDPA